MTKADWIKLAMPASLTLLALAIITQPADVERLSVVDTGHAGGT
ncbi:hypothetical protein [Synechococcus sp. MIT S9507]